MEYSVIIQEFIDGTIDETTEDNLFSLLSSNREIRKDFKNHLFIESTFKDDSKRLIPTAAATAGVFSRIGYGFPAESSRVLYDSSKHFKIKDLWIKYSQGIYSGIASSIITAIVFLLILNSGFDMAADQHIVPAEDNRQNTHNDKISSNVDFITESSTIMEKVPFKYIYITKHDTVFANSDLFENREKMFRDELSNTLFQSNASKSNYLKPVFEFSNTSILKAKSQVSNSEEYKYGTNDFLYEKSGLSFGLSAFQDWALNGPAVPESYMPKFNNIKITLSYKINDNLSIGLDIRKEFFYQEYTGYEEDGIKYIYRQNTNYIGWGVSGKYRYNGFRENGLHAISPFARFTLGGNKAGPIIRVSTGFDYEAGFNNTLFLAVEGSALGFYHDNNYFYAPKIGINFGVDFDF